jgi:hypothetical protein
VPCAKGMPVRRDDRPGSGCHRNCLHRAMVEQYREHRDAWERRRDEWAVGYATERAEYAEREGDPAPTLTRWLRSWWAMFNQQEDVA